MTTVLRDPLVARLRSRFDELVWPARAVQALDEAGVDAWAVGGFVRDVLIGREPRDLDIVVDADAANVGRRLAVVLGGSFVALHEERDIARVVLLDGATLDIGRLRHPSIEDDLSERDFTIDAVAVAVSGAARGEIADPHRGFDDIESRFLRLVRESGFRDDGVRLLRAVRLGVDLELSFDAGLLVRARGDAARVRDAAPERLRDELMRLFETSRTARGLRVLDRVGVLAELMPAVAAGRGVTQPREHYYDVLDHNIEAVAAVDGLIAKQPPAAGALLRPRAEYWRWLDPIVDVHRYFEATGGGGQTRFALTKLAALLHDVAKPQTRAPDAGGRIRFLGHAEQGAALAATMLRRLRFSNREIAFVRLLVSEHLRPTQMSDAGPPTDRAIGRFFRDLDDAALAVFTLSIADHIAARGPRLDARDYSRQVVYVAHVIDRRRAMLATTTPERLITGDDLMREFRLAPGPLIGRVLRVVADAQSAGEVRTRDEALALAHQSLATCR